MSRFLGAKRKQRVLSLLGSALAIAAFCTGAIERTSTPGTGTFTISNSSGPYIAGGPIALRISGVSAAPIFSLIGPGAIENGIYSTPPLSQHSQATIVAATASAVAIRELQLVPPPGERQSVIAVACYYGGIALHSPVDFSLIGIIPTDGSPSDVAIAANGDLYSPATDGVTMLSVSRAPWRVSVIDNVPFGNEVVVDDRDASVFVSNRDVAGKGALTRLQGGKTDRVVTGVTAEALVLDAPMHRIFVGNVNDASVLELDTRTLEPIRRINSVARTFGVALDTRRNRLFVVSNQNATMRRGGGYVARIDLSQPGGRISARSANLPFPLGVAYDARTDRVFVTDEDTGLVSVLDASTLLQKHVPLTACELPWRPHLDLKRRRMYVPCARANKVAVFDLDTLKPLRGSPFVTAEYPLGIATPD